MPAEISRRTWIHELGGGLLLASGTAACRRNPMEGALRELLTQTNPPDSEGKVAIVRFNEAGTNLGLARVPKVKRTDAEWQRILKPAQYYVTRQKNTDQPFSGTYYHLREPGLYACICCDNMVFSSDAKYDSGTGWPSFWQPIAKENVRIAAETDPSLTSGIELMCTLCDAHLGHVFGDGPSPTYLRYCINESSLRFVPRGPHA